MNAHQHWIKALHCPLGIGSWDYQAKHRGRGRPCKSKGPDFPSDSGIANPTIVAAPPAPSTREAGGSGSQAVDPPIQM